MGSLSLLLVALCVAALASPAPAWQVLSEAPADAVVAFSLPLKKRNLAEFDRRFVAMTTPGSPEYGKHMSKSEVLDLIAPPALVSERVMRWIRNKCSRRELVVLENRRDTVRVECSTSCASRLFGGIRFARFRHSVRQSAMCTRLHPESMPIVMPPHIKSVTEAVIGLDMLPVVRKRKTLQPVEVLQAQPQDRYDFVWLGSMNKVYQISSNTVNNKARATQSVVEFTPEGAPSLADLQQYAQMSNIPFSNVSSIVGPWNQVGDTGESSLDIQLITAVAQTGTVYITINDGWVYGMAQQLFNMNNTPAVNSVSYGWPETFTCSQNYVTNAHCNGTQSSQNYIAVAEFELKKLGAVGVTVVVCSQDEGAPSEANNDCSLDSVTPVFSIYPGSSAYALSVSATTLVNTFASESKKASASPPICQGSYTCSDATEEVPCTRHNTYYTWTTGGGFADYVPQPAWQQSVVSAYLKTSVDFPPTAAFNSSNRAYPDVASVGSRILVIEQGAIGVSAGTSASTPIWAGVLTLINDALISKGKPVLGFVNPLIYTMKKECPQCFNVIATGDNTCTTEACCRYGYYVSPKADYNAVTGLGTPRVSAIISYILNKNGV